MTYDRMVSIGPEFFAKAKKDYSDWKWAIAREFMQNCIDPKSSEIEVYVTSGTWHEDGRTQDVTTLTVKNNGRPMDEQELVEKLLALGASGKDFLGTTGGFGKAKEILYFCHLEYQIHSGIHIVRGSGAGYNLEQGEFLHGTESVIAIAGNHVEDLVKHFKNFASMCQWHGVFRLNGEVLDTNLRKGSRRRGLGWATIYTNKSFPHRMIVRVDGMPMFQRYVNIDRCVLVEVNRSSGDAFQSSRDGLVYEYRQKLDAFIDELTVDRSSALRDVPITEYFHFHGDRQEYGGNSEAVGTIIQAAYATLPQVRADSDENTPFIESSQKSNYDDGPSFVDKAFHTAMRARCSYEFVVKNNTGLTVPAHFMPGSFSAYSEKLVRVWVRCLLAIHRMHNHADSFAVGFLLDDAPDYSREAEYEQTKDYGKVYYINPAVVVKQQWSASRSFKKRWKFVSEGYYALLVTAAHEFVHGLGFGPHDDGYVAKHDEILTGVLARKKDFHPCFR